MNTVPLELSQKIIACGLLFHLQFFSCVFHCKNVFHCFSEEERRYITLQQSNKDYEGVSLLHNYLSLVIFILILKIRSFRKKEERKRSQGVEDVRDIFLVLLIKKSKLFLPYMRFGNIGLRATGTYCLLPRCTRESSIFPKKQK